MIIGLETGGILHIDCLGNDFSSNFCSNDSYIYGMKTYDYKWVKQCQTLCFKNKVVIEVLTSHRFFNSPDTVQMKSIPR